MANQSNEHNDLLKLLRKLESLSKELNTYFRQYPTDKVSINTIRKTALTRLSETRRSLLSLDRIQEIQESNTRFVVMHEDGSITAMSSNDMLKAIGQHSEQLEEILKGGALK